MAIAQRSAETEWNGDLTHGAGRIRPHTAAFDPLDVTWASRTESADGRTSPEELAAAAHSSCFAMALALCLGNRKVTPERLLVNATVTLDQVEGRPTIVSSRIAVRVRAAELDRKAFDAAVREAAVLCPISRLFAGAAVSVTADLELP